MTKSLQDDLTEIDEAIAELEDRRTHIINKMSTKNPELGGKGSSVKNQKVNGATAKKSGLSVSSGKPSSGSGVLSNVVLIR